MFIPVGDENPLERTPFVTLTLIGANILLFFLWCWPEENLVQAIEVHALLPSQADWLSVDWWKDVFTSMFMHANFLHLAGNMIFLWIFGDNVEDKLGPVLYLFFYFICGIAAALLHVQTAADPAIPTLGASGAVSGALGAYVVFFPVHHVRMFVFPFGFMRTPAFVWIGVWFLEQVMFARMANTGVAWYAHIGGFAAGVAIAIPARVVLRRRFRRRIEGHG